jgi:integrase
MAAILSASIKDTLPLWRTELKSQGKASGTIDGYIGFMRRVADRYDKPGKPYLVKNIGPIQVAEVLSHCKSSASRSSFLVAYKSWSKWCIRMHYTSRDKVEDAIGDHTAGKATISERFFLPGDRFGEALEVAGAVHPQRRMVVALMLYTLGRQCELSPLQLGNIDRENRNLGLYRYKTKRFTDADICLELAEELDCWLTWYASDQGCESVEAMLRDHPDWYLLPRLDWVGNTPGHFVVSPTVRLMRLERVVKQMFDNMDITVPAGHGDYVRNLKIGGHTIRRSGARAMYYAWVDKIGHREAISLVQAMLDHKAEAMTLHYIGIDVGKENLRKHLLTNRMYGGPDPAPQASEDGVVVPFLRPATQEGKSATG